MEELERKYEELEKRVAALEGRVQAQPANIGELSKKLSEKLSSTNLSQREYTSEFEVFWSHYPKRIEKHRALKAWNARLNAGVQPKDMIFASINYAKHCDFSQISAKFIKHPAIFLGPDESFKEYIN